ncbi:type III pantothenate kinase [Desertivirga xinjiangensis]|uniref:type III pantothenate kinase n=1 Tax=Desertivirga xinjiangensis TaxID=539206 RepID=UPI00210AE424|nr:type III pantothenate kinase [Pedobacter xinjiangensis]
MYNLVIDIGNTFSKVALFDKRELCELHIVRDIDPKALSTLISDKGISNAIMSTVRPDTGLEDFLEKNFKYLEFSTSLTGLINNHYKTPQTLGLDRYAAVVGAAYVFQGANCLVIDAGTCITYDFIDGNKNYYGGSISPGMNMRYKAMHTFTGKLPLLYPDLDYRAEMGNDTRTSMLSGVQNGLRYEVEGFIRSYFSTYPNMVIALCGGDADFFDRQLKNSIFAQSVKAVPDLVLIGLNEVIHHYND